MTIALCAFILLLSGCVVAQIPGDDDQQPKPLTTVEAELFPLSSECTGCHNDIYAENGAHYSYVEDWFNSVHGQSALDPVFMAMVRHETELLPEASDAIQEICASCHLPMADMAAIALGISRSFLENAANPSHELNPLYREGDSCMICHQFSIDATEGSVVFRDTDLYVNLHQVPLGQTRNLYGYHKSTESAQQSMRMALGYSTLASNFERSNLICSVCHNLYTDAYTVDGQPTGKQLPEQTVTQEWLASGRSGQSCQSCHMPVIVDPGPLSNRTIEEAAQGRIGLHNFVGANTYLFELNGGRNNALEKGLTATTEFLQSETATLLLTGSIASSSDSGALLTLDVMIDSLVAHKFPSGFPSRRAWLHVQVIDESGALLYESGGYNNEGMILDNDGDLIPGAFEPHYAVIDQPGQVQIYESVMLDSNGRATTNLLQGIVYCKDNRLLPIGIIKDRLQNDIAVFGDALYDDDFVGGRDITHYLINLPAGSGNLTIKVELLYQSVGYRFLEELLSHPSPEQQVLADLVKEHPNLPALVVSEEIKVSR